MSETVVPVGGLDRAGGAQARSVGRRVRALFGALAGGALVVVLGGLVGWLTWRSLEWPLVHDAPLMHYVAWRISEGAVPYRDLFDMNFPGVYLLHLGVMQLLGPGDVEWRLFDLGWLVLTAAAVAAVARRWSVLAGGAAGLFFALYHLAGGATQAGQRDFLMCPFLMLAALGVARVLERWAAGMPGAHAAVAWGALAMGAAIAIKPHAALLAAALGALLVHGAWRAGRPVVPAALLWISVAALIPAALLVWLAAVGGLDAWRAIVFEYLVPLYSRVARAVSWNVFLRPAWLPLAAAAVLGLVAVLRDRRLEPRQAVAVAGMAYGLAHWLGQGKGWEYHLTPLAAFAAAFVFLQLGAALAAHRRVLAVALLVAIAIAIVQLAGRGIRASAATWAWDKERVVRAVVWDVTRHRPPGGTVQVLDTAVGGVHALLRLEARQPTRFLYDFHFFHDVDTPTVRGLRAEFVRDLDARPPAVIVLFRQGWPTGGYERVETFPELRDRLARDYTVIEQPAYRLYARRDRS